MSKEILEQLQGEVANITKSLADKVNAGQAAEVKELSDKLTALQAQVSEKRHQFAVDQHVVKEKDVEVERKMDELLIASTLMRTKSGHLTDAYGRLVATPEYRDALKAAGFTADPMTTGAATNGAEFIPTAFSSTLQEEIFLKLEIADLFGRMNMPSPNYVLPFSPGRTIAQGVAESGEPTKVKAKTAKITFDAQKIMSNIEFTDEFEQDSIVAVLPFIRKQLIDGFALAQETMSLNGDINGDLLANGAYGATDCRKLVAGIRADATNAAAGNAAVSFASGGFTADNLRSLRTAMGKYGKTPSDLAIIVSMADYNKMLATAWNSGAFQMLYSYGAGATLLKGEMGRFDNIPIIVSELVPLANAASTADLSDALGGLNASGQHDYTTAGNNTKTTCVLVNKNAYMWGDRKEFSLETFRNPYNQTLSLIGSQRLDFQKVLSATSPTCAVGINY